MRSLQSIFILLIVSAWVLPGCAGVNQPLAQPAAPDLKTATETPEVEMVVTNPEGTLTPVTPAPRAAAPEALPGQPMQVPGVAPAQDQPPAPELVQPLDPSKMQTYTDNSSRFTIAYPSNLTPKPLAAAELAKLQPTPVAAVDFTDSRNASIASAPPAFSIRVFQNANQQALENWLTAAGLLKPEAGGSTEPFRGKSVTGIKVMTSNFIAPGWSVYVAHRNYVLQLTPLGLEAEQMLDTFKFMD